MFWYLMASTSCCFCLCEVLLLVSVLAPGIHADFAVRQDLLLQVLTARKSKSFRRSTSSGSAGGDGSAVRLAPPPGQGGASAAAPPQQQQQAPPAAVQPPQQPSYLDAFTELQQVRLI